MTNRHPHRINWFEIPVTNIDKAAALYAAVLGVELKREDFFGVPHAVFLKGDQDGVTGTLISDPKRAPSKGVGTVVYLHAKDGVAACLARATTAGAKVVQPTTAIGPFGTIALIEDLDGNVVGLHAPA
jgi:predicted enzyme related to lactoylglutathione lyase